jgi:hypothetical protein
MAVCGCYISQTNKVLVLSRRGTFDSTSLVGIAMLIPGTRYGTHFSLDGGHVKQFGTAIFELASTKGVGAEQDRYGSHFNVDESDIEKAKQRVKDLVR